MQLLQRHCAIVELFCSSVTPAALPHVHVHRLVDPWSLKPSQTTQKPESISMYLITDTQQSSANLKNLEG